MRLGMIFGGDCYVGLCFLGICFVKLKNLDKAKEYLKRAVQLGRNEKSFMELASLYESCLDYVNAIDVYTTALR